MNTVTSRVAQVGFVACAVGVVMAFAAAVQDGEHRRAPDALVQYLAPSYTGNNRIAPNFDLVDRAGRHVRLEDLRGKVVVLHFWTRTCEPCIEELTQTIPAFDEIVRDRSDIAFLMVTVDANWESISALVPQGVRSPILFDPDRHVVSRAYGTRLFPETWVIDPHGIIRARFDHPLDWASPVLLGYLTSLVVNPGTSLALLSLPYSLTFTRLTPQGVNLSPYNEPFAVDVRGDSSSPTTTRTVHAAINNMNDTLTDNVAGDVPSSILTVHVPLGSDVVQDDTFVLNGQPYVVQQTNILYSDGEAYAKMLILDETTGSGLQ